MELIDSVTKSERREIDAVCARYWSDSIDPDAAKHAIADLLRMANACATRDECYEAALQILEDSKPATA